MLNTKFNSTFLIIFMFFGGIYLQGAAFHSASNMFKNSLESIPHDDNVRMCFNVSNRMASLTCCLYRYVA